jgi:hypothetical protein
MTAKEMFESLGYKQTINSDYLIEYVGDNEDNEFVYIRFYFLSEEYAVGYFDGYIPAAMPTTIKEHEAITQQLKELCWI